MTEQELRKTWMARARDKSMTIDTLPSFLKEMAEQHPHDYGSICLAIAAAALAAATAMDRSAQGGITGFQAGVVMWEFMAGWQQWPENGVGHRLQNLDNLLYPQYDYQSLTISPESAKRLRERARETLAEEGPMDSRVRAHMKKVAEGWIPFGLKVE